MNLKLENSICALVTPFDHSNQIDQAALSGLLEWHCQSGTSALVLAGSTGESAALDEVEFEALIRMGMEQINGRMPILAGAGAASTDKTQKLMAKAKACGADAALVVTPYYVRPTQEGLYRHYMQLADSGCLPIVLYNVPGRTGCDLLPETVARLKDHPQIIGIKEARSEQSRMQDLIALKDKGFAVLSGDDGTALRSMLDGADGVISVAANVCPLVFSQLCGAAKLAEPQAAKRLDERLQVLYQFLNAESNPIPAKWLLNQAGRIAPNIRLPLLPLSNAHQVTGTELVEQLGLLESKIKHEAVA